MATVARPTTKKKGPKVPRKPRTKCMMQEIVKLDADFVKRRERRANAKELKAVESYTFEVYARRQARHLADVEEKESIVAKVQVLIMLGLARPAPPILSVAATAITSMGPSVGRPRELRSPNSCTAPGPPPFDHGQMRFSTSPEGTGQLKKLEIEATMAYTKAK
ncbi:hypothetical protein D1007_00539 [Hordeum vulgare]|nr:hypothetical protein D1007_00539 [Hordeum vulgare]